MRLPEPLSRARVMTFGYAALTGAAAVAGALTLPADYLSASIADFWWIAVASLVVILPLVVCCGLWSAAGAYVAVFWCFHFGLVTVLGLGIVQPADLSAWDQMWVLGPFAGDAGLLAVVGLAAFATGASLVNGIGVSASYRGPQDAHEPVHPHTVAGPALVLIAIALWCAIVLTTGGAGGFFASYGDYLDATADFSGMLAFVWLALGCGLVLSATGAAGWLRTNAMAAFGCLAIVALPVGLRGEIMFPSIAALVAAARCGRVLSPARTCALAAALLIVIPAVREIRNMGVQGVSEVEMDLHMFDAFAEMGGSLHPVEKVVRWRAEGEPLEVGASYWAPIERAAARVLPGLQASAAEDDMRIMNVLVMDRIGPIGFSPVAEAYRNFGAPGVAIVLGLLGAALAWIDRIADRRLAVLAIATLYVPILTNVRNSFVSVPLQCVGGVAFVLALGVIRHVAASARCRSYACSPYVRREI
jgi:O-antigen polysaccharide polymerase Wzy-like protein